MNNFAFAVLTLALLDLCYGAPLKDMNPEETAGFVEGDMVIRNDMRIGLIGESFRWPGNIVYYKFGAFDGQQFDHQHINHILRGMGIIEKQSCIRFKEADASQTAYINITGFSNGCYSAVGYENTSQVYNLQIAPLEKGCFRLGTIVHELLHTLGFYHTQNAYDRDKYVAIIEKNIKKKFLFNFDKYDDSKVDHFGIPYDYGSIMHYGKFAFSTNGEATIVPLKPKNAVIGQRNGMSIGDIAKLNEMYHCPMPQ